MPCSCSMFWALLHAALLRRSALKRSTCLAYSRTFMPCSSLRVLRIDQFVLASSLYLLGKMYFGRLMLHVALRRAMLSFEEFKPNVIVASSFGAVVLFHMRIPKLPLVGYEDWLNTLQFRPWSVLRVFSACAEGRLRFICIYRYSVLWLACSCC